MIVEKVKTIDDIKQLLETLKLQIDNGKVICNLEPHLERLAKSIGELGFKAIEDLEALRKSVLESKVFDEVASEQQLYRVRILYNHDGSYEVQHIAFAVRDLPELVRMKVLDYDIYHTESNNPIHKHKYLPRPDFSEYLDGCDEVLWLNERHEICEGSKSSVFFFDGERWHTPSLKCGILPSITRIELIKKLNAIEGFYKIDDLRNAKKIIRTSAVIGECEVELV